MKRILFFLLILCLSFQLTSCEYVSSSPRSNPIVRYFARPKSMYSYRYMQLLYKDEFNPQHLIMKHPIPPKTSASVQVFSSSIKNTRLIDYPIFMDSSGFMTTIKKIPAKTAILDASLAEIWKLAGGTISATVPETVSRGITNSSVTLIPKVDLEVFDYEFLLSYKPDLVILNADKDNQMKVAQLLRIYDIPVLAIRVDSFLDYLSALSDFTEILETPENYEEYGSKRLDQIETVQERCKNLGTSPKVLLEHAPQFLNSMVTELGAKIVLNLPEDNTAQEPATTPLADIVLDVEKLEKSYLFSYLPNHRWPEAYEYLATLLYVEYSD